MTERLERRRGNSNETPWQRVRRYAHNARVEVQTAEARSAHARRAAHMYGEAAKNENFPPEVRVLYDSMREAAEDAEDAWKDVVDDAAAVAALWDKKFEELSPSLWTRKASCYLPSRP